MWSAKAGSLYTDIFLVHFHFLHNSANALSAFGSLVFYYHSAIILSENTRFVIERIV